MSDQEKETKTIKAEKPKAKKSASKSASEKTKSAVVLTNPDQQVEEVIRKECFTGPGSSLPPHLL